MKKLMLAVIAGAALMWFYDPANGAKRRDSLMRTFGRAPSSPLESETRVTAEGGLRTEAPLYAAR